MPDQNNPREGLKLTDHATLSLLSELESESYHTQRGLAQRIGIALGLTNSLLKRAIRKGLVKVKEAPAKRYAYYVTPKGFSEKSRLVAGYLGSSLAFFRQAREEYAEIYEALAEQGHKRVALCGIGDLAEIAMLSAQGQGVQLCGIIEPGSNQSGFTGLSVYSSIQAALEDEIDVVVITTTSAPQDMFNHLAEHIDAERIYAAPLLHITRTTRAGGA